MTSPCRSSWMELRWGLDWQVVLNRTKGEWHSDYFTLVTLKVATTWASVHLVGVH